MYSSSRAKQIEKKDVAFLSAGIHDDVFLTGVRYGTSVQGRNFIEFKFVKDNRTMTHTEWEPRRTTSTGENLPDDVFYAKVDNQWERIKEILICYYKEEELQYEEEGGFKEYAAGDQQAGGEILLLSAPHRARKARLRLPEGARPFG